MRTVIVVAALLALALASGASFVVKAQEPGASATLDARCEPGVAPSGVPTLVTSPTA